jgi:hypothetical protein
MPYNGIPPGTSYSDVIGWHRNDMYEISGARLAECGAPSQTVLCEYCGGTTSGEAAKCQNCAAPVSPFNQGFVIADLDRFESIDTRPGRVSVLRRQ